jgi:hypothetical protein
MVVRGQRAATPPSLASDFKMAGRIGQPCRALCLSHGDGYEDDDALRDAGESNTHSVAGSGP